MEWYRILIVVVGALGMALALANWYFNGVDIPNGVVTILSLVISTTLGPEAISKVTDSIRGKSTPPTDSTQEEQQNAG